MPYSIHEGYLIYSRGKDNKSDVWQRVYYRGLDEGNQIHSIFDMAQQGKDAGQKLLSLGAREFEKERALLAKRGITINDENDVKLFIQKFNEMLQGTKNFKDAVNRLRLALSEDRKGKKDRAPTIASFFTGYLEKALSIEVNQFIDNNFTSLSNDKFTAWNAQFDLIIKKSINLAFQLMLKEVGTHEGHENNPMYGDASVWHDYYNAALKMQGFSDSFVEMIKSKFDFNSIKNIFEEEVNGKKIIESEKADRGLKALFGSKDKLNLDSEIKARTIGGSVQEFLESIADTMGLAAFAALGRGSSGTKVFSNEIMKTDNVSIYSFGEKIDSGLLAQRTANLMDETMRNTKNLQDAAKKMIRFYDTSLRGLDNTFVVYGSTKSYSLSDSFRGFSSGGERQLEELPQILSTMKICNSKAAEDFIYKLYNTAEYTIFSDERAELTEQGKYAIMSAAGALLFDDWQTIGEENMGGGAQCIHALQLDGIRIPLSVFLKAIGQAIIETSENPEEFFNVHLKVIDSAIEEWAAPGQSVELDPTKDIGKAMLEAWNYQLDLAKKNSSFKITFLQNFKQKITEWVNI